ncbi:MAG: hypothetical protein HUK24_05965 [Sphaerochaetaceae bacterium]|nr:hypothetical protein [Sphaerochaetaceae bacterium]
MKYKTLIILIIVSLLFISCKEEVKEKIASIELSVTEEGAKLIAPSGELLNVSKYVFQGTGPSGATFGPIDSNNGNTIVTGLVTGSWTITATACNEEGNGIATGSLTTVLTNGRNTITVPLDKMPGRGNAAITITWDASISTESNLTITVAMEDSTGWKNSREKTVSTSAKEASFIYTLPSGCYIASVTVKAGNKTLEYGGTEAVRIMDNTLSEGTIELKGSSGPILDFSITNQVVKPLNLYITYGPKNPPKGSYFTLTANYDSNQVNLSDLLFQWYEDGVSIIGGTGASVLVECKTGIHRYDVVMKSSKEGSMTSASLILQFQF